MNASLGANVLLALYCTSKTRDAINMCVLAGTSLFHCITGQEMYYG